MRNLPAYEKLEEITQELSFYSDTLCAWNIESLEVSEQDTLYLGNRIHYLTQELKRIMEVV